MNKIYFASYKTIEKEPNHVLDKLEKTGFDGLEILSAGKHDLSKEKNRELFKKRNKKNSFSVHAPYKELNLASENEKIRKKSVEEIKNLINYSKEIGADHLTIHPGHFSNQKPGVKERAWQKNQLSLKEITKEAEDKEVNIGLENLPETSGVLGKTGYEINGLVDSIDNNYLNVSFDIGHANTTGQINTFLNRKENIGHIHLHDNLGKKDSHKAIGEGEIDFNSFLKEVSNYDGAYVIEARDLDQGQVGLNRIKTNSFFLK